MNLKKLYFTKNDCYKSSKRVTPMGIMWHATGVDNSNLRRYVGPNDGLLGENKYNNHWNQPRPDGQQICPHGFMGKLEDGTIATYQVLPWNMICWLSGTGSLGYSKNANNQGYIQIEICEDNLKDPVYFELIYKEAVEVSAYLCKQFNFPIDKIICHSEGYTQGIASNHADVMHWFPRHGKSMDTLRADVAKKLNEPAAEKILTKGKSVQVGFFTGSLDKDDGTKAAERQKAQLIAKGFPATIVDAERYI